MSINQILSQVSDFFNENLKYLDQTKHVEIESHKNLSYLEFNNAFAHFVKVFGAPIEEPEVLDVAINISSKKNVRFTVDDLESFCKIKEFKSHYEILEKEKVSSKYIPNVVDTIINLKYEMPTELSSKQISEKLRDDSMYKMMRYKKRYSFRLDKNFRADFSIVRSLRVSNISELTKKKFSEQTY